jgi:hypothetical protein
VTLVDKRDGAVSDGAASNLLAFAGDLTKLLGVILVTML